jgi:hypothetical protein
LAERYYQFIVGRFSAQRVEKRPTEDSKSTLLPQAEAASSASFRIVSYESENY